MKTQDYSALCENATELVRLQLNRLNDKLKSQALSPAECKELRALAEWLSEMALIEKEELASMTPDERRKLNQRQRWRRSQAKKHESSIQAQGNQKEARSSTKASESTDRPEENPL